MATTEEIADTISGFVLFADLSGPQLQAVAHQFEEAWFPEGERILRQGLTGSGFFVIVEGTCSIRIDGEERARLGRGDYFGEGSILLGMPPVADVVAVTPVRCIVLAGPGLESFLNANPKVTFRMLQAQTRRLTAANKWRG